MRFYNQKFRKYLVNDFVCLKSDFQENVVKENILSLFESKILFVFEEMFLDII